MIAFLSTGLFTAPTFAFELGIAGGKSSPIKTDVELSAPPEQWTFEDLNFKNSGYISTRLGNWVKHQPRWGWGGEINYIPHQAQLNLVDENGSKSSPIELNYYQVMFNTYYRWFPSIGGLNFEPYLGAGLGIVITKIKLESSNEEATDKYRYTGFSGQAITGIRLKLMQNLNLALEYKLAYLQSDAELGNNIELNASPTLNLLQLGLYYQF